MKLFESIFIRRSEDVYCKMSEFVRTRCELPFSLTSPLEQSDVLLNCTQDIFPFQNLPVVCKLRVFSYLKTLEKGICRNVCKEWSSLLKLPSFWRTIDLDFTLTRTRLQCNEHPTATEVDSDLLNKKMSSFVGFLDSVGVKTKNLTFDFEICFGSDIINNLLESNSCSELKSATITWNNLRPTTFGESEQADLIPKQDLELHRRRQQRQMVIFFNRFVKFVPDLEELSLPFDWSVGSISAVSTLSSLKRLFLLKYSDLQSLTQSNLDLILNSLTNLEILEIQVSTPSTNGLQEFSIKSQSLKHLNMSESKGICLSHLKLPNLICLEISVKVYKFPLNLNIVEKSNRTLCLYALIKNGTPALQYVNNHKLEKDWQTRRYHGLEKDLPDICPCAVHLKNIKQ